MPIYEYHCNTCGTDFEVMQKFSDPPLKKHDCARNSKVHRKLSLTAFQLKGGGWYKEGYASGNGNSSNGEGATSSDTAGASNDTASTADGKKDSAKPESKSSDAKSKSKSSGDAKAAKPESKPSGTRPAAT